MNIIQALILGIVQGLTEFLPVSSSAHLVFAPAIMKVSSSVAFDAFLHLGTLTAVVGYFWRDILALVRAFFHSLAGIFRGGFNCAVRQDPFKRMAWLIVIGSIPAAVLGLLFKKFFEELFSSIVAVAALLIGTGLLLFAAEMVKKGRKTAQDMSLWDGLVIGLAQAAAIAPGISRSGATISAGLFLGLDRELAARFSFLLSIPAILGATILQFRGISAGFHAGAGVFLAGFAAAALCGGLAIHALLRIIRQRTLRGFAAYCCLAGAAVLMLHALRVL
jgi:undecaprenyl-diphosphatase